MNAAISCGNRIIPRTKERPTSHATNKMRFLSVTGFPCPQNSHGGGRSDDRATSVCAKPPEPTTTARRASATAPTTSPPDRNQNLKIAQSTDDNQPQNGGLSLTDASVNRADQIPDGGLTTYHGPGGVRSRSDPDRPAYAELPMADGVVEDSAVRRQNTAELSAGRARGDPFPSARFYYPQARKELEWDTIAGSVDASGPTRSFPAGGTEFMCARAARGCQRANAGP
jgi:hypothetical protein